VIVSVAAGLPSLEIAGHRQSQEVAPVRPEGAIKLGIEVEVRNRFTGEWSVGFEMVGRANGLFHVRRLRDGAILPVGFGHEEIRVCGPATESDWSALP
jgi:hypothetical protein